MKIYDKNDCRGEICQRCRKAELTPRTVHCGNGYIILFEKNSKGMSYKAKNGRKFDV